MCGIAGFYDTTNALDRAALEAMSRCIAHRGPDADGFFMENGAGLAHRRLSIIDLSAAANQPMHSQNGRYAMVFNGEVFNYREAALELGLNLRTHSDTEVVLESFAVENLDAVKRWNGFFALALFDRMEKKMYLMRDRLGVKPLYYCLIGRQLLFASEIKSLASLPHLKPKLTLNRAAVRAFLNVGYIPGPHTIYNEIKKLPSGAHAVYDGNELKIERYWKPQDKVEANVLENETQALDELQRLMQTSVRYRMIADVPFGTFLSGGVDSSLVTALAQEVSGREPVKTFSIAFKESRYDESRYARAVAKHLGTQHHEFTVTEQDALDLTEQMLDAYDEPYADSSGLPTMLVSRLARKHVTMVLSGDGGDELFMGYGAYRWARRLEQPLVKAFRQPIGMALSMSGNRYRRAATLFTYENESRKQRNTFSQEQYFFSDGELNALLLHDDGDIDMNESNGHLKRNLTPAERQSLFDLLYYLRDDLLVKVDIASMRYALEVRTPFLDYRVVEFALNLHERLKQKNGTAKHLVKELLYRYVPREMFDRPKWGFAIPLKKWMKTDLSFLVEKYLSDESVQRHGLVDPAQTKKLIRDYRNGRDYLYNRVWALVILHRWMDKHATR